MRRKWPKSLILWGVGFFVVEVAISILLGASSPSVQAMVVGSLLGLTILGVIFAHPEVGVILIIPTTALDFYGHLRIAPQVPLTFFHLVLIATFISWILKKCIKGDLTLPRTTINLPLAVFFVLLAFSLLYTPARSTGFSFLVRLLFLVSIVFLTVDVVTEKKIVKETMHVLMLSTVGISVYAAYGILTQGVEFIPIAMVRGALGLARISGTFLDPNKLAMFIGIGVVMLTAILIGTKASWLRSGTFLLILSFFFIVLLSTFSRSGLLSTVGGLLILLSLMKKRKAWIAALSLIAFFSIMFVLVSPFASLVISRIGSIANVLTDVSNRSRIFMSVSGLKMFVKSPVFGLGLRAFPELYPQYMLNQAARELPGVIESHVLPITLLAELGIAGFVVWFWFVVRVIRQGIVSIKTMHDGYLRTIEMGLVAVFAAFLLDFMFYSDMMNNMFWLITGLMFAVPLVDKRMAER